MSKRTIFNSLLLLLLSIAISAPAQKKKKEHKKKDKQEQSSSGKKKVQPNASVQPQVLGIVQSSAIQEASGLAASRALPGYFWTHNDSGNKPEVYLLDNKGQLISTIQLEGIKNRDWEDIAEGAGPIPHKQYVYVGDIGNNIRLDLHTRIYRFQAPSQAPASKTTVKPETLQISYPDGPRDAETVMVDPINKFLYVVSKREKAVGIYKTPLHFRDGEKVVMQKVGTVPYTWITAGDISQDGRHIVIKDKSLVYYWSRQAGETVEAAMARPAVSLPYVPEQQGEGIALMPDNSGYVTISEGKNPALNFYPHRF
ncbi:hypothetical protein [Chitinophaga pinensis]|uniref:PE-PGRS family protein n=1 Tax=Chitinophaga pinensis (strain ATCC 43595 / DSM 2588 / LMG 13176 / NBRC 15968 / NCIMB 11800 / UQM 2034) TaxID=485918 RepID=A0A979GN54_CHIPD|nr:hypothetical protein [Chitinophaga pinensis]ACU59227.1 conserved hypothetical protein [Chitinophaga pinensis DSM 2588]